MPPIKFQKGGLTRPQLLDRGCREKGVIFFRGGLQVSHKNKLKSEILNDKKSFSLSQLIIQIWKF